MGDAGDEAALQALPIGNIALMGEQQYRLTGTVQHLRRDGTTVPLLTWDTTCPDCGATFEAMTVPPFRHPRRRCDGCKAPGRAVRRTRRVG